MMKKLLLFTVGGAMSLCATAQDVKSIDNSASLPKIGILEESYNFVDDASTLNSIKTGIEANRSASKTTAPAPRWYNPYDIVNALNSSAMDNNRSFIPIWFDSTIHLRYNNTPPNTFSPINFASLAQIIDPIGTAGQMFNDASFNNTGMMWVQDFNSYSVDSVEINIAYVKNQNRPTSIVDTLILSVAPQSGANYYVRSAASWVSTYIPSTEDTLYIWRPDADSVGRTALSNVGDPFTDRVVWKEFLTDADRDTVNTANNTITTRTWRFAVPGGKTIPAGSKIAFSATFKSGDTWTPLSFNDSVQGHHNFRILSSCVSASALQKYNFYTALRDRNHSSLMFTTSLSRYQVSYPLENVNGAQFGFEHHRMGALVSCATCWLLDVPNTQGLLTKGGAYPNPSSTFVKIPFELTSASDVNVTLTNTVGQVVRTQNVSNVSAGEVTFNTRDLNSGMYLYTIQVNGQSTTGRITVAH